jgi:hypothetical protein
MGKADHHLFLWHAAAFGKDAGKVFMLGLDKTGQVEYGTDVVRWRGGRIAERPKGHHLAGEGAVDTRGAVMASRTPEAMIDANGWRDVSAGET